MIDQGRQRKMATENNRVQQGAIDSHAKSDKVNELFPDSPRTSRTPSVLLRSHNSNHCRMVLYQSGHYGLAKCVRTWRGGNQVRKTTTAGVFPVQPSINLDQRRLQLYSLVTTHGLTSRERGGRSTFGLPFDYTEKGGEDATFHSRREGSHGSHNECASVLPCGRFIRQSTANRGDLRRTPDDRALLVKTFGGGRCTIFDPSVGNCSRHSRGTS